MDRVVQPEIKKITFFSLFFLTYFFPYLKYLVMTRALALVAVEPRRPPNTNVGTETAFRHDHCKPREHIQIK